MNIGEVSKLTNSPAKTLRYYEEIGLITPQRADNGYQHYTASQVESLRFLARAHHLGFSIDECRSLIGLYENKTRKSADVRQITLEHIKTIDDKIMQMQSIRETLARLVTARKGG